MTTVDPRPTEPAVDGPWPGVSVVMPVLNERRHLADAVGRVLAQDYPGPLEVVVALGPSHDGTGDLAAELAAADPRVRTVDNPTGRTPAGLNAALRVAAYDVIVRVDGHALIPDDYVRAGVETLQRTGADNVGGIMGAEGVTEFEQAVARAMTTKLGVGAAAFHVGGEEGPADTVYLGCFRRSALERVGGYDEEFVRAQDWEMNHRIRDTGGLVWFTPRMHVTYRPRPTFGRLARQYFEYGRWRREVMRRHPETARLPGSARYLAPPLAVTGVLAGTVAGVVGLVGGPGWLRLGWLAPAGYAAIIAAGAAVNGRGLERGAWVRLPAVYVAMHAAWGAGFLTSPDGLRG
ncbi:MAG: glycosyltransferase family 2 protein [Candidatus Nanopelagicales bacterium]